MISLAIMIDIMIIHNRDMILSYSKSMISLAYAYDIIGDIIGVWYHRFSKRMIS